jgi:hypothetical protein
MNNQIPRYILKKIENYLDPSSDKEKISKIITLEHILPKNPDKTWLEYLGKKNLDKDDLIYKLGNMTLLTKKMNADMHNEFFITKRDNYYTESKLKINDSLKEIDEWDDETIQERQKSFGKLAIEIWKI